MSKEIKKTLKEARDAIKVKDYSTCIKQCKWVLKEDPENYMALVLLGAAYQESDFKQANKCFRKAVETSPTQILAWQGLVSCLEKQNPSDELAEAYGKLLEMECEKNLEVCQKLLSLSNRLSNITPCVKALQDSLAVNSKTNDGLNSNLLKLYSTLAQVLMNLETIPPEHSDLLENTLVILIGHPEVENHREFYRWHLKRLYSLKNFGELWDKAKTMYKYYPQDSYSLEWICKLYVEQQLDDYFGGFCKLEIDIDEYVSAINNIKKPYDMSQLAESVMLLLKGDFVNSRDLAIKVAESRPAWLHGLYSLSICYHKLNAWNSCEHVCTRALAKVSPITAPLIKVHLDEMLIESLIKQEHEQKLHEALQKCEAILSKTPSNINTLYFHQYIRTLFTEGEYIPADTVLTKFNDFQKIILQSLTERLKNNHSSALEILLNGLKDNKFDTYHEASLLLECGKVYKLLEKLDESLVSFLKSARLNQFSADAFYYIADCYTLLNTEDGIDRAKKCLQRSMHFDPLHPKAGSALSRLYRQNNQLDENLALLQNAVSSGRNIDTKWAWLQLGLHHLSNRDYDSAINSLRVVIRIDPNDARCWESLADAYLNRGSYVSAQKSFKRTLELNPHSIYAKIRIANINQSLGQFREATIWYKEVLQIDEHYLLALKGLGETYYLLAKQAWKHKMPGLCRRYCQMAVDDLFHAIKSNNKFVCLYRLFANCIMLVLGLPDYYSWLEISKVISPEHNGEKLYKLELFDLAKKFYYQTLKMSENNDNVWNELAINYHDHAVYLQEIDESRSEIIMELLNKSFSLAQKAVVLAPSKWQHWNTLGYIACNKLLNKLALAQHCYIKAINIKKDTAVAWTNLGVLYEQCGDQGLANRAFARAQESNPSYVGCWIGQSFIARKSDNDDTLDLFRHSVQLAFQPQSCLGYASIVCEVMQNIKRMGELRFKFAIHDMHAIILSTDVLVWYLEYYGWVETNSEEFNLERVKGNEDNIVCAFELLGHFRSHQKLYRGALTAYQTAVRLCKEDRHDQIQINLAKVYLKLLESKKALNALGDVKTASYASACTLAQAYFQCGLYEQCFSTYQSALVYICENEAQKNAMMLCMARLAFAFQGPKETQTLLFQCLSAKTPLKHALFAGCAFGILQQDTNAIQIILSIMNPLVNYNKTCATDIKNVNETILFLRVQHLLMLNKQHAARNLVLRSLRLQPTSGESRLILAKLLLRNNDKIMGGIAANLIETCLELPHENCKRDTTIEALVMISRAQMQSGDVRSAKIWAQRAIFRKPDAKEAWHALQEAKQTGELIPN